MNEKISVCIPVYNGALTIRETVMSVLLQTYKNFELVITDNISTDDTIKIIRSIKDPRIKLYINKKNVGCGGNLEECKLKAQGDIIFYLSADDIAEKHALEKVADAFKISEKIGMVTRPYFWFANNPGFPVRTTKQFKKDKIVTIKSCPEDIKDLISLSDQISGNAFRKKYIKNSFENKYFIEMASVLVPMIKTSNAVILKDNIIAVRIGQSGALNKKVYCESPMMSWYNLISKIFPEKKYIKIKNYLVSNFIANNYIGLIQIKNYGTPRQLFREINYLLKLKPDNILSLKFWFFSLGTILCPRFILIRLVPLYKDKVNSKIINKIKFDCAF